MERVVEHENLSEKAYEETQKWKKKLTIKIIGKEGLFYLE